MRFLYCAIWLAVPTAMHAHHGPGQFDSSQAVEVTGAVTDVRFVNPHGYIYFDVTETDGTVTPWRCELQAGSLLRRAGWTEDLFPIGGTITVSGSQGVREAHACALRSVVLADGSVLQRNGQRRVLDAPTRAGHSIGRWEDGALVVDTVGFAEGFIVAGPGGVAKNSEDLHVFERFTYDAETQGLTRSYTAEDQRYFSGQYTGQDTVYASDVPFEPYACVELKDAYLEG